MISDDPESIKTVAQIELPSAKFAGVQTQWQRRAVHFERNVICHVPAADMAEVASDLKGMFAVHRTESAEAIGNSVSVALAAAFVERYGKQLGVLKNGLANALTFLSFPSGHHRILRTTNGFAYLQTA